MSDEHRNDSPHPGAGSTPPKPGGPDLPSPPVGDTTGGGGAPPRWRLEHIIVGVAVLASGLMFSAYRYFARDLPSTSRLEMIEPTLKTQVFGDGLERGRRVLRRRPRAGPAGGSAALPGGRVHRHRRSQVLLALGCGPLRDRARCGDQRAPGRTGAGWQHHHPAVGTQPVRHVREHAHAQDQGGAPCPAYRTCVLQGRDPGDVPQSDLLRRRRPRCGSRGRRRSSARRPEN